MTLCSVVDQSDLFSIMFFIELQDYMICLELILIVVEGLASSVCGFVWFFYVYSCLFLFMLRGESDAFEDDTLRSEYEQFSFF